jgi:serine/threonine-protein kinase
MSPEQALGGEHLDGRADQYSLACVFYEMLVGQPPFDGPNSMAILARHSMESVPSLQVVRHSIPDEVEDAVMRALEKTPADRFPTVRDFSDALLQADLGPTARRTSPRALQAVRRTTPRGVKAPQSAGSRRARFWAVSLAGLVALAGTGFGAWKVWHRSPIESGAVPGGLDPHRIAVLYFQSEGTGDSLTYLADGLTEGLIRELDQVQGLEVISRGGVAAYRGEAVSRDSIARALEAGTLVAGGVEQAGRRLRVNVRLVDGSSGADFGRASFEQPAANLLTVQDTLAQKVAGLIRQRLGEEVRLREQRNRTTSAEAWALVQQANLRRKAAEAAAQTADSATLSREFRGADSILARAESLDARWVEPVIGRGTIAYRQARLGVDDPLRAGKSINIGLSHAERALRLAPQSPDALQLRGDLRYLRWLLNLVPDPVQARTLLKSAQKDLEAAVRISPSQAGAWAMLSHLYYQAGDKVDVKLAARRAYEADAYLSNADVVLSRLFYASYDLGQFTDAVHWCEEGERRFPADPKFAECRLWLLTTKAKDPDVSKAWQLSDTLVQAAAEQDKEYQRMNGQMLVAGVLARAGLADSARRLATRSRGRSEIDPNRDLLYTEAIIRTLLGDKDDAIKALKSFLAVNPEKRSGFAEDLAWYFRPLENEPGFRDLVGAVQ